MLLKSPTPNLRNNGTTCCPAAAWDGGRKRAGGGLHACKQSCSLVNAVVDVLVHPRVDGVDLAAQHRRVQIQFGIGRKLVKFCIEHAKNVLALVVDDPASLFVQQDGDLSRHV